MTYKTLIFGTDDLYPKLKPLYDTAVKNGILEIVAEIDSLNDACAAENFDIAIISSRNDFYRRMKLLEAQGFPRSRIVDGTVFNIPNLDFPRLFAEGVAYSSIKNAGIYANISDLSYSIYRKVFSNERMTIKLGVKSYISNAKIGRIGTISIGNFCALAWSLLFEIGFNWDHNHKNIGSYGLTHFDWRSPKEFYPIEGHPEIRIGSDVWIGQSCTLKCANPNKPLIVGDGAVIASGSVVVKNVPPYAIVGGNPAQVIKYRFPPDVIEALLRIKWWDWDIDKLHDNFKYFNDIEKFISLHDRS